MEKIQRFGIFVFRFSMIVVMFGLTNCSSVSFLQGGDAPSELKFNYGGEEYKIISYSTEDTEGYNYLIKEENDNVIIKCIDQQQDGVIDEVITGNISLDEANTIYSDVITMAEIKGSVKKKYFKRYYGTTVNDYYYDIKTYILASGQQYNIFSVMNYTTNSTVTLEDEKADGRLDNFQNGNGKLEEYQRLYKMVIQKGLEDKKIKFEDGSYQVTY
jgi:hypothetical protein